MVVQPAPKTSVDPNLDAPKTSAIDSVPRMARAAKKAAEQRLLESSDEEVVAKAFVPEKQRLPKKTARVVLTPEKPVIPASSARTALSPIPSSVSEATLSSAGLGTTAKTLAPARAAKNAAEQRLAESSDEEKLHTKVGNRKTKAAKTAKVSEPPEILAPPAEQVYHKDQEGHEKLKVCDYVYFRLLGPKRFF